MKEGIKFLSLKKAVAIGNKIYIEQWIDPLKKLI
jgi:hypothetical protein